MDPGQDGLVIAVGARDVPAARRLAAATSRQCLEVTDISAAREAMTPHVAHAVLVGAPRSFQLSALTSLARHSDVPFGIISGDTQAATERQIEARLARARQLARVVCVDAIYRSSLVIDTARRHGRVYSRWGVGIRHAFEARSSLAVLCAHGSANHVNLERAVMCGLGAHDREFAPGTGGCWRSGTRRFCKRGRPGQPVVYMSELQADVIALLTCCGFAINGELFPSIASLARAAMAGGSTTFLTTMTLFVPQPWEARYVTDSIANGMDVSSVMRVLNTFHYRRYGVRPYITFGDPACRFEDTAGHTGDWRSLLPAASRTDTREYAAAVGTRTPATAAREARRIEAFRRELREVRDRVEMGLPVLAAWTREVQEHAPHSTAVLRALARVNDAHRTLHGAVLEAWTFSEHAGLCEPWAPAELRERRDTIAEDVALCDRLTAAFLKLTAFPLSVEEGFTSGLELLARRDGETCDRCGCTLMVEDWGAADRVAADRVRYSRHDCPICGFRWIGPASIAAPRARMSRFIQGGGTISLRLPRPEAGSTRTPPRFWIVMKTKLGPVFFSRQGTVPGSSVTEKIPPLPLPADIHAAAWGVCGGLRVWYGRMLCASGPSPRVASARRHKKRQK